MKRYLITGAVLTGVLWAGLSMWAAGLPDPITAWGFGLIGTVALWVLLAFAFAPPFEFERDASEPFFPENERHGPTQEELDLQHQRHLAEQARYMYLAGDETPPTDWYRR